MEPPALQTGCIVKLSGGYSRQTSCTMMPPVWRALYVESSYPDHRHQPSVRFQGNVASKGSAIYLNAPDTNAGWARERGICDDNVCTNTGTILPWSMRCGNDKFNEAVG
jgi:hypothetical protein